jgi:hypothetical protein
MPIRASTDPPMWRLILGTALAALPRRWRDAFRAEQAIPWERAAILSGFLESLLGLAALGAWYSHSASTWAANALASALRGGPEAAVPGQAIGFSALVLWCLHPWTWLIAFFAAEGAVRILAALSTGEVLGLAALGLADWSYGKAAGRPPEGDAVLVPSGREQLRSLFRTVKGRVHAAGLPELADEITRPDDSLLAIHSSRPKGDWIPPRVVRIGKAYYRLESVSEGPRPRPFIFHLRRLEAGVPGRTVIVYEAPDESPR